MEMTFTEYINNPMGRKNAVISNREMHRTFYTEKFNKILLRENGNIIYALYTDADNYYIHINIPSEVVKNFYYDVLVKFSPPSKVSTDKNLESYNVQFFSNDPAFVYTFAHSFIENKLFITDLEDRMSKEAVKKIAKEKNPKNEVGYVKSLYFAYLYMKAKGLFNKSMYNKNNTWKKKDILNKVMYASDKIEARQAYAEKQSISKKNTESKVNNTPRTIISSKQNRSNVSNTVGTVKNVSTIGAKKKKGYIKPIKKI